MKFVISRYNNDISWLNDYPNSECIVYDRSDNGTVVTNAIVMPNIGTDLYDKFTFIIDNYDNLPDVAVYTKANLWKYISKEEFDLVKDNQTFTPLLTKNHKVKEGVSFYKDGMYHEINNYWYLGAHPAWHFREITEMFEMGKREYNVFAPGSNYILPKENILKHSKEFYERLKSFLDWDVYPGDAMLLERCLYVLWK